MVLLDVLHGRLCTDCLCQWLHLWDTPSLFRLQSRGSRYAKCTGLTQRKKSGPQSVHDPPGLDEGVCTVGAVGFETNAIASYSSRGPVKSDGSGRRKPDIVAPGSSVRSAWPPMGYNSISGTSMATPAVAGAVALLWDAFPDLKRDISATEQLLFTSALPLFDETDQCGGDTSKTLPNNVFGHGLIDLKRAYTEHHQSTVIN